MESIADVVVFVLFFKAMSTYATAPCPEALRHLYPLHPRHGEVHPVNTFSDPNEMEASLSD